MSKFILNLAISLDGYILNYKGALSGLKDRVAVSLDQATQN